MGSLTHHGSSEFETELKSKIYTIRGMQVMLDSDLADLYNVETKNLNKAVSRNLERFPEKFRFKVSLDELNSLRFQIGTSKKGRGGRRYEPFVFTEQGVAMLSAVLKSHTAVQTSIKVMDAFVAMRQLLQMSHGMYERVARVETIISDHDKKFDRVFTALEAHELPKQGIFYEGQIFDAHSFTCNLIRNAKESLVLIDNFIDDTVLTLLSKRKTGVLATIFTKKISKQLELDLGKYNEQYPSIDIRQFSKAHDRFLIIDEKEIYHIGASLKDLGKSWFAFSKLDKDALEMVSKLGA